MHLTRLTAIVAIVWAAEPAWSQPSEPAGTHSAQFANIRPTYRLMGEKSRTARAAKPAPGRTLKKSGNITPLTRDLPNAVARPPNTRRREIPW